jgi:hypothetical protein
MADSITCPQCGMTSYHPEDILQRYCGNCHRFHDEPPATFTDFDYHAHDNERDKSLWRSLRHDPKSVR